MGLVIGLASLPCSFAATPISETDGKFRGSKVEWARLVNGSPYWNRHAESDAGVIRLMQQHTSLNVGPRWQRASARSVEEMSRFPFLYTDTLAFLRPDEAANLAEYLRRGGFILIDACRNKTINPDIQLFLRHQVEQLSGQFPDLRVGRFTEEHEIFSIYFKMHVFPPFRESDGQEPLYAVFSGTRLIGAISLNGWQCAWAGYHTPMHAMECMQMVTNIYVYAMTR